MAIFKFSDPLRHIFFFFILFFFVFVLFFLAVLQGDPPTETGYNSE